MAADDKSARRAQRQTAIKTFNMLGAEIGADPLIARPSREAVENLYRRLCENLPSERTDALRSARKRWCDNGGAGDLPENLLLEEADDGDEVDVSDALPNHGCPRVTQKKPFRLCARAFMLTFNALAFASDAAEWRAFHAWVEERKTRFKATYWSATLEQSLGSEQRGRAHFHAYFSWHGAQKIDHRSLENWVYKGVRPRVDVNRENRGPSFWMKAVHHGHFYVQAHGLNIARI